MNKKPSRFKKKERAKWEIDVVRECRDVYNDRIAEMRRRVSDEKLRLTALTEKIRATEDAAVCGRLYEYVENTRMEIDLSEEMLAQLCRNRQMIVRLLNLLEYYFYHGQYAYIIRKVPERALPKIVGGNNKVGKVYDLVYRLYAGLYARLDRSDEQLNLTEEGLLDLRETHSAIRAARQSTQREAEIAHGVEQIKQGAPAESVRSGERDDAIL